LNYNKISYSYMSAEYQYIFILRVIFKSKREIFFGFWSI